MPRYPAPANDLDAALAALTPAQRRELVVRWAERVHELAKAIREEELRDFVDELVDDATSAADHETGDAETVRAEWIEAEGRPGAEVPYTDDEERQNAIWRASAAGAAARTLAHLAHDGYRAEVALQYRELTTVTGTRWGKLEAGERFRVYSTFEDLDGRTHPWGEAWRFDGYTFDPSTCIVTLRVSDAMQLAPNGTPGPAIDVPPFRMPLAMADDRNRLVDPLATAIDHDR